VALFNHQQAKLLQGDTEQKSYIFIKQKNYFLKLKLENILFLKSDHVYLEIHMVDKEKYVLRESLADFESKLNTDFI
jgi:DNA-binding LytR/AlgR family response regulator